MLYLKAKHWYYPLAYQVAVFGLQEVRLAPCSASLDWLRLCPVLICSISTFGMVSTASDHSLFWLFH